MIALLESLTKLLSVMTISLAGGTFNKLFNLLVETFHQHDPSKLSHSPSTQNAAAIFATASNSINQSINEISPVCSPELKDRLNDATLSTIANLVSGNLELGIARLIEVAWNGDPKLRRLILEAVSRVLNQKSSNSATAQAEIHAKLCELHKLITIITDEGTLPLVNSLINALPTECSVRELGIYLNDLLGPTGSSLGHNVQWETFTERTFVGHTLSRSRMLYVAFDAIPRVFTGLENHWILLPRLRTCLFAPNAYPTVPTPARKCESDLRDWTRKVRALFVIELTV